jgi:hypothetical protein
MWGYDRVRNRTHDLTPERDGTEVDDEENEQNEQSEEEEDGEDEEDTDEREEQERDEERPDEKEGELAPPPGEDVEG